MQAIDIEQLLPDHHQVALAHRRQHLFAGQAVGQLRITQMLAAGGHGARANHHDIHALAVQGGQLAHQFHHMGTVKAAAATGEHAGAQFDHDATATADGLGHDASSSIRQGMGRIRNSPGQWQGRVTAIPSCICCTFTAH